MNLKLQARAFERVRPMLQPGEEPVAATRAQVGRFRSGRLEAVARSTVAIQGGLGAAMLMAKRQQFLVLTDWRLIFLTQTFFGGPGDQVLGEVPAKDISLAEVKFGVVSLIRLAFGDDGDGVSLTLPRIDRKNAEAFAEAVKRVAG
jgi:hypothetical protein